MENERGMTVAVMAVGLLLAGCTTYTTRVENAPGRPTVYENPGSPGAVQGIGMESQDIISMTDQMMRDMLTSPTLAGAQTPPQVIVDAEYFRNEGATRLNKNIITDRLRVGLNRAANGRMVFVGRHYAGMVEKERALKGEGIVGGGTRPGTSRPAGADYRLGGRIATLDAAAQSGLTSRFHQITFEMVDLNSGVVVWSGIYSFRKAAQDDVVYR